MGMNFFSHGFCLARISHTYTRVNSAIEPGTTVKHHRDTDKV